MGPGLPAGRAPGTGFPSGPTAIGGVAIGASEGAATAVASWTTAVSWAINLGDILVTIASVISGPMVFEKRMCWLRELANRRLVIFA
jgi:hypothetical protein